MPFLFFYLVFGWGGKILSINLDHNQILVQSHFLSDAFFDNLRSVRFTDRSIISHFYSP
ncbi:MAG: hypothetical protein LBR79_02325 [Oscillospiraceae bacterium]|nr:hypothetical protein [Oscillospiraceae bacterium]